MAKRKRPARRNENRKRTDAAKERIQAAHEMHDRIDFRCFVERDWLGAFGAWLFADLHLPTR